MKLDLTELLKKAKATSANIAAKSGNNNIQKPPAGKSRWRILPGWRPGEEGTFHHEFAQHWIKEPNPAGGDALLKAVIVCEDKTFGRQCDCCDQINTVKTGMKAAGFTKETPVWKQIDEMRGKLVYLVNALRQDGAQKSDQPIMLGLPETAFNAFLTKFATRAEEGINMLDLESGIDIVITRTGTGLGTEYDVDVAVAPSKVPADVMTKLINIDAFIESERQKGVSKTAAIKDATRKVLGGNASSAPMLLTPSSASLVAPTRPAAPAPAPSRVIEENEVPFATVEATPAPAAPVAAPPVTAAPVAQAAPVAAPTPAPVSSALLDDDELSELLKGL